MRQVARVFLVLALFTAVAVYMAALLISNWGI